jgi:benzoyl-CoA reductase/2-hydroxyglutaryl-CoA dehydratase subunit BcrC/BadD/HgdB
MSDENRQMWQDLGMDLETHDLLLDALPGLYEKVYLSQPNRPKRMEFYDLVVSDIHGIRPKELIDAKKTDKKVIVAFCVYVPEEIVLALDAILVGLCGGTEFSHPAADEYLPRNLCALIKSSLGFKLQKTCAYYQVCDLIIGETTCEGKKKMFEILEEHTPMYVIQMPPKPDHEDSRAFWLQEMKNLITKLEEITGNKLTAEKLKEGIKLVNEKRKALQKIAETRKVHPPPISGKDALLVTQVAFYDDVVRATQKATELYEELQERIKNGVSSVDPSAKRIMISGTPMAIPNWKMHDIVETSGGAVVVEENCTGARYYSEIMDVDSLPDDLDELIKTLADRYLDLDCACFTPNDPRLENILKYAEEFKVDGVIYYCLQSCLMYSIEVYKVERALKERGIPFLKIETDYGTEDVGQLYTRVEAFIEMLK